MADKELNMNVRDDNVSEETKKLISSLPTYKDSLVKLCKYQGCWYYYNTLQAVINFQNNFQPQDTDIILASFPKSGTTWLKALSVALLERSKHDDPLNHPLLSGNPHGIVPFFEIDMYLKSPTPDLTKFSSSSSSSSRLFSTHMPLHTVKQGLKDSPCKVVYLCRNAKDALISRCGVGFYGPIWDHALSYWRGSLENPESVLFMRYEELKRVPCPQLKRLAEFLGCPFTKEEEESGLVEKIIELCSFDNLSGLEVNRTGKTLTNVDHDSFFRKGEVGGWKNYLTPEMENKIDMIIDEELKGSGLTF
ncbi:BnaA10g30450D [Brassica napus]|uniref:Sulfotransferase n=1 Tax=Brassica napus TaxID=3708 RepID=A0A078J3G1_BRANA|nr:BnaA10g30450D [Brassica napus]